MLRIYTSKEIFVFENEDEINVYEAVNDAGMKGSEWTTPIKLQSGKNMIFVLSNIIAIEFD